MSRTVKKGLLSKRCRWSWRPRYVELISTPSDISGPQFGYLLLIYDQSYRSIKNKIYVDNIVTIRAGKNFSFQIYLNSGMFLFFRTGSAEDQAAWMADIKMALGKGSAQFHVRVTGSSSNNLILDHALLYCVGVNLPSHSSGQSDRVLVLASPVNDVNMHAWNLSRVKRFVIIDAGIQMELCSQCIGSYQKKVITFLLPIEYINNCMLFLLHEMHAGDTRPQNFDGGPTVYDLPHQCSVNPNPTSLSSMYVTKSDPPPYCNDAELAVLHTQDHLRHFTISTASTQTHEFISPPLQPSTTTTNITTTSGAIPSLPPRDNFRPNYHQVVHTSVSRPPARGRNFETPYHISQRIIISDNGTITKESQILGSGSGEFRKTKGQNPIYISTDGPPTNGPSPYRVPTKTTIDTDGGSQPLHQREFIGRRPPMIPPRSSSPPEKRRSFSESELLGDKNGYQNRQQFHYIRDENSCSPPPLPPPLDSSLLPEEIPPHISLTLPAGQPSSIPSPPSPSPSPHSSPISIHTEVEYVNVDSWIQPQTKSFYGSSSSLCTDDVTNAEFALMTKVSFKNIIPSLPPRHYSSSEPKRPMPIPRQHIRHETHISSKNYEKRPVPVPRQRAPSNSGGNKETRPTSSGVTEKRNLPPKRRNPSPPDWCLERRPRSSSYVCRSASSEGSLKYLPETRNTVKFSNEC